MRRPKDESEPEVEPRRQGEPLEEYTARLVGADKERIRIHSDYVDSQGNVIVMPVIMLGKDTSGDYRPARMDTEGRLDVVGFVPTQQDDALLTQANPISGAKYTVLDTTENIRIYSWNARSTWTVQPSPIELHIMIDGLNWNFAKTNPVSNTTYTPAWQSSVNYANGQMTTADKALNAAFWVEGASIKVEAEITGGTVSELRSRVKWAKW